MYLTNSNIVNGMNLHIIFKGYRCLVGILLKISITVLVSNDSDSIIFYLNHDADSARLEFQLFLPIQSNADCTPTFASLIHGIICIRKKEKLGRCYVQVDTKPNEEDVL